jgi:hypothetical protein
MADSRAADFIENLFWMASRPVDNPRDTFVCYDCGLFAGEAEPLCDDCADRLRDRCGIPSTLELIGRRVPGSLFGPKWRRWRIDVVFSLASGQRSPGERAVFGLERSEGEFTVEYAYLWRQVIALRGSPLHLARYRTWDRDPEVELHGLERTPNRQDVLDAIAGTALFLDVERRGRPKGSLSIPNFPRVARDAKASIEQAAQAQGKKPRATQEQLSGKLLVDVKTLRRHIREHRLAWPSLQPLE